MNGRAPALFISQSGAPTALARLAELYFLDVQTFGCLATFRTLFAQRPSAAQLTTAELRGTWVASFLQTLEAAIGLRFGQARVSYCYTGEPWDPAVPPAGSTDTSPTPLPSHVVTALCRCWNLAGSGARQTVYSGSDAVTSGLPPSSSPHFLRAALWTCKNQGLAQTIDYLFDLQQAGFLVDGKQLVDLIDLLLLARCQVKSDEELVSRFFGGQVPPDLTTWSSVDITLDWIAIAGVSERWHFPRFTFDTLRFGGTTDAVQPVVIILVERALEAIERVRAVASWDEWLVAQLSLGVRLEVTLHMVSRVMPTPSIALRSVVSLFQEIRSDVNGLCNGLWMDPNLPSFVDGPPAVLFKQIARQYHTAVGDGWEERLFAGRALVPYCLKSLMLDRTTNQIPAEWDGLSWRIAHPVSMALRPQTSASLHWKNSDNGVSIQTISVPRMPIQLTRVSFDLRPLVDVPAIRQAFEQYGVTDKEKQDIYLHRVFGSITDQSASTDRVSETSYALAIGQDAIAISWPHKLRDVDQRLVESTDKTIVRYDISENLLSIRSTLCDLDVTRVINTSFDFLRRNRLSDALGLLASSLAIYPWHPALHHQRAVALAMSTNYEQAIDALVAAILLEYNDPGHWDLLAATLVSLGSKDEARIVLEWSAFMKDFGVSYRKA